jgi:hypothetical protein
MCRVIQAQLPRNEASARQAAHLVRATVEEWLPDVDAAATEAAEEMTRALVTNAVVHALSRSGSSSRSGAVSSRSA